jgi:hypothetical protein
VDVPASASLVVVVNHDRRDAPMQFVSPSGRVEF